MQDAAIRVLSRAAKLLRNWTSGVGEARASFPLACRRSKTPTRSREQPGRNIHTDRRRAKLLAGSGARMDATAAESGTGSLPAALQAGGQPKPRTVPVPG
jgi:hypothetical protein